MNSYNLTQVVDFPTRITNTCETLIDTVFIDVSIYDKTQIQPVINGISDHDAQFLCPLKSNITLHQKKSPQKIKIRLINEQTLNRFNLYGPALPLATQAVRHFLVREGDLYKTPTFFGSCDRLRLRGLWGFRSI